MGLALCRFGKIREHAAPAKNGDDESNIILIRDHRMRPVHRKPHTPRNRNRIESPVGTPRRNEAPSCELRRVVGRAKPRKRFSKARPTCTRNPRVLNTFELTGNKQQLSSLVYRDLNFLFHLHGKKDQNYYFPIFSNCVMKY